MTCTPARLARLKRNREYDRIRYTAPKFHKGGMGPTIPDDVEVRVVSTSCFMCESRGPCRHRVREFA